MFKAILIASVVAVFAIFYGSEFVLYVADVFGHKKSNNFDKKVIKLFTAEELKLHNGVDKGELYLSLLGNVFDVTAGSKHYGPGQSYNAFVGRDASRNFINGKFHPDDISDDVVGLESSDFKSLDHWLKFYKKQYIKVGVLIGRYYDENGKLTQYGKEIKSLIKDARKLEENANELKRKFPPCNAEWNVDRGSRVWCTTRSGGIERNFIGFPRKLYEPGANNPRCACVKEEYLSMKNIKEYENCDSALHSCYVKS